MKRKYGLIALAGALVLATATGGTLAALNTNTEGGIGDAVSEISTKGIGISVTSVGNTSVEADGLESFAPGGDIPCAYCVTNDVADGYGIYAKVTIDKVWDEDTLDSAKFSVDFQDGEVLIAYPGCDDGNGSAQAYAEDYNAAGAMIAGDWIIAYADDEQIVLYYTKPLLSGESSDNFMDAISVSADVGNAYADAMFTVDLTVDAVQTNCDEDAMQAEWGVFPLFDDDGNIINVYETREERDAAK